MHYLSNRWCQIYRSDTRDSGFIATSHPVPADVGDKENPGFLSIENDDGS